MEDKTLRVVLLIISLFEVLSGILNIYNTNMFRHYFLYECVLIFAILQSVMVMFTICCATYKLEPVVSVSIKYCAFIGIIVILICNITQFTIHDRTIFGISVFFSLLAQICTCFSTMFNWLCTS